MLWIVDEFVVEVFGFFGVWCVELCVVVELFVVFDELCVEYDECC